MMKEHWFVERGISYRTNDIQSGRPTLIFIHGVSGSCAAWARYEHHFGDRYNVLSYDIRGHGKSRKYSRAKDYTLALLADDLHALVTHLPIREYAVIGHSFGSLVAMEYLTQFSNEVCGSVLISPMAVSRRHVSLQLARPLFIAAGFLASRMPQGKSTSRQIGYDECPDRSDWDLRRRYVDILNTGITTYLFVMQQIYTADYVERLQATRLPILLIHGTKDTLFPMKESKYLAASLPQAQFKAIPGADHILILNQYDAVVAEIDQFIRTLPWAPVAV